jgi:uncharacterized membrane protein
MVLRLVRRVDPLRALGRAGLALAVAILGAGALWGVALPAVALLAGWNLGGLGFLTVVWATLWTSDPETTRAYAAADDPGRYLVFVLVLLTSAVSLFSSVQIAGHAATLAHAEARSLVLLSFATVALSWCMTHTAFALRYAHL